MSKISLVGLQTQMMNYLIDDQNSIAESVIDQGNISKETRLHIYKNAYVMRLKETIENDHQYLGVFLGDDLFEQMVKGYLASFPSSSTSLRHFADQLPDYLSKALPFKQHPIISELAHFERSLLTAFDAKDANTLTQASLLKIPHEEWPTLVFRFHPSVQITHYSFNTVETWQALKQEQAPSPAMAIKTSWLLWRNEERLTEFRSISAEENELFEYLIKGHDFATLCDYLLIQNKEEDIGQLALTYLLGWVNQGLLVDSYTY